MAEAVEDTVDCLLCSEELVEPVTLGCEHRFCCRCLREHWAPTDTGDCPTCKRRSFKYLIPPDFALKKGDLSQSQAESLGEMEKEGRKHPESATAEPGVSEGAASEGELSEKHQSDINKLKEKKERTEEIMKQYKSMLEHTEGQTVHCETQIRAQFEWFQLFLAHEEALCLSALRKEHQEKTEIIEEELKKLEDKVASLSDSICSAEQQLQGQSTQSSSLREHMESLLLTDEPEPQLRSGLLIDQARVLGNLGFRVWQKMETIVNHSPVILDPNTAHGELHLSEDLTSLRLREIPQDVPLNPERFTNYSSVLGSEGFSSGWHEWVVEVGDHPDWTIGVAKESAERRSRCGASPEDGFWCLKYQDNEYTNVNSRTVELKSRPEKIRVELYYDSRRGSISFYDPKDMTLICSHHGIFTEMMFPYFSVGGAGDANVTKDIKIRCK